LPEASRLLNELGLCRRPLVDNAQASHGLPQLFHVRGPFVVPAKRPAASQLGRTQSHRTWSGRNSSPNHGGKAIQACDAVIGIWGRLRATRIHCLLRRSPFQLIRPNRYRDGRHPRRPSGFARLVGGILRAQQFGPLLAPACLLPRKQGCRLRLRHHMLGTVIIEVKVVDERFRVGDPGGLSSLRPCPGHTDLSPSASGIAQYLLRAA
jgi:hypothetical protein